MNISITSWISPECHPPPSVAHGRTPVQFVAYPSRGRWQILECYSRPHLDGRGKLVKALSGRHTTLGSNLQYRVIQTVHFKSQAAAAADALNILNSLPLQNLK